MSVDRSPDAPAATSQKLPAGPLWPAASPSKLPSWIKVVPFVLLHLALLFVFIVPVDAFAVLLCAVTYYLRMFGITAGYHRYFAHRAYKSSRVFQFVLAWLGCSALQKGPLWWAAHHREHHLYSDTPRDPHSPYETSFWWSHVGWILSNEHTETPSDRVPDWTRYPELCWLDRNHWVPGIVLAVVCFLIGGWSGLVWGFVVSTILVYHATFTINSLSHLFGSRRYATTDDSRNNFFLAIITLGEGWHNNHHHYQSSANQGFYWWEIDMSYVTLLGLSCLGLVWDLRRPTEKAMTHKLIAPLPPTTSLEQQAVDAASVSNPAPVVADQPPTHV
ncbi:MAG: fatty acid desaturase [Gemmataceae bacterium]